MKISSYLCIDDNRALCIDADDEAPLLKVEFCNELQKVGKREKMILVKKIQTDLFNWMEAISRGQNERR